MMGRKQNLTKKVLGVVKDDMQRIKRWWLRHDRENRTLWRLGNAAAALLILTTVLVPVVEHYVINVRYKLSSATIDLVGENNMALAGKLRYNSQTETYEFNKEAVKEFNPADALESQVGGAGEKSKSLYALDVPKDPTKGVTYHDVNSQLSFKMTPQFRGLPGKVEQGRLVFPLDGGPQAVYTLKNNGLKEDIVVSDNKEDTLRFAYNLELPKSLEARMIPGGDGAVGIYSGDPTLFSEMTYGSDKDRVMVEKAREKAEKNYLVFGIPAPVITKHSDDSNATASARFELRGGSLTVVAEHLSSLQQTFSIDPSVVVTSTSDFSTGNNEGNIDFSTANEIKRGVLTGGTVNAWRYTDNSVDRGTSQGAGSGAASGLITDRTLHASVAYNGYLYAIGGRNAGATTIDTVEYAPINSNGTVGTWLSTSALPEVRTRHAATLHNGYIYISGGTTTNSNAWTAEVRFAAVCTGTNSTVQFGASNTVFDSGSDCSTSSTPGTLSAWKSTTSLGIARGNHAMVAYANRVYVINGCTFTANSCNGQSPTARIYCGEVSINGEISTWDTNSGSCNVTGLSARDGLGAAVYNGYIYIAGGCSVYVTLSCSAAGQTKEVQYAKINSDGSLSDWLTSANQISAHHLGMRMVAAGGYLYLRGGDSGDLTTDTQYAPVYANGDIGAWKTTAVTNQATSNVGFVGYGGYLYEIAGCDGFSGSCTSPANGVQYAKIDTPGTIGPHSTDSDPIMASNGIRDAASVIYGGYIYTLGGINTAGSGNAPINTVRFAKLNADGSTGAWGSAGTGGTFNIARSGATAAAYNGYMYIAGGITNTNQGPDCPNYCFDIQKATINSDGTLGAWSSAGGYYSTTGRDGLRSVIYNDYIYIMGGNWNVNSNVSAEIDIAPINPTTGNVGTWVNNATGLNLGERSDFGLAQSGKYVYLIGGRAAGSFENNNVWRATLGDGGTISAWVDTGANFPDNSRLNQVMGTYNGYLYTAGGLNVTGINNALRSDIRYIKINMSDGSLTGGWILSPVTLPSARAFAGGGIYNGFLYTVGGCTVLSLNACSGSSNSLSYTQINNGGGGSTGAWAAQGASGSGRIQHGGAAYNGYLYIAGGCSGGLGAGHMSCAGIGMQSDVRYVAMGSDGSAGTWASAGSNFTTNRFGLASVAYNGYLYVMGGCSATTNGNCTTFQNDVQYAQINANGTLGSWASAGTGFSTGRYGLSSVAHNGYMYVLGGCSAVDGSANCTTFQNDVQYAQINANGTLGSWASAGTGFSTGRLYQNAVINSDRMYVLGGCSAMTSGKDCTTFRNDVQSIALNPSNGTLSGSWVATTSFSFPRYGSSAVAYNGYLYLVGGCRAHASSNCTSKLDDIMYAPFASGGLVGNWTTAPQKWSTDPGRLFHVAIISQGYMAILNGLDTSNGYITTQQTAPIQVQPKVGRWSKVIDLGIRSNLRSLTYGGNLANGIADISYKASLNNDWSSGSSGLSSAIPSTRCQGVNGIRYVFVTVTIDDSTRASFPDADGIIGNATDVTALYEGTRPPNIRMRLGQTLQNGTLSDLDICKL